MNGHLLLLRSIYSITFSASVEDLPQAGPHLRAPPVQESDGFVSLWRLLRTAGGDASCHGSAKGFDMSSEQGVYMTELVSEGRRATRKLPAYTFKLWSSFSWNEGRTFSFSLQGSHSFNSLVVKLPHIKVPKFLTRGKYKATATISDKREKLGCLRLELSVK